MTLSNDMTSKKNWTQEEIDGLKKKYSRTHFTHFTMPRRLKGSKRVQDDPEWYEYAPGRWRKLPQKRERRRKGAEVKNDDS